VTVPIDELPADIRDRYDVHEWKHAHAILAKDFPDHLNDVVEVLRGFRLSEEDILTAGGGKSPVSQRLDGAFLRRGWSKKKFDTEIVVDGTHRMSPTHEVDCVKGRVALEIEWSNKDPFYDRDLNNFRLLFDLRAISVGIIVTKTLALRPVIEGLEKWDKYGMSTTWMEKLVPRVEGGGGGGCPLLAFGIRSVDGPWRR